jgi:LmbE family N-acetylglucosaminyl deacetylase
MTSYNKIMAEQQRLLGFFAHPDDEILGSGGSLAYYAAAGVQVELVCATRGEAGEISDPALATPETLAVVREAEMLCSAETLGVSRVTFLDHRDSGMAGTPDNDRPDAFVNAPAETVVPQLVEIIRRVRPQIILTFEPYGGYGHPDHIAIHHHTVAAFDAAADPTYYPHLGPAWPAPRLFYPFIPLSMFKAMIRRLEAQGVDVSDFVQRLEEREEQGWPEEQVNVTLDVSATVEAKLAAFRCHQTQFGAENIFRRLPEAEMKELLGYEYFALARPVPPPDLRLPGLFDELNS